MVLSAFAESEKAIGETVNIGSNFEIAIGDVVDSIKEIMNSNVQVITDNTRFRPEKSEVNNSWITKQNQWKPSYTALSRLH